MARRSDASSSRRPNSILSDPKPVEETPIVTNIPAANNEDDDSDDSLSFDFKNKPKSAYFGMSSVPFDPSLLPKGSRSLSSIGLQSFWLGFTLALGLQTSIYAISQDSSIWRLPTFLACLSVFHFLEYYTTARFNFPAARASSFLLFNNGTAYNVAHSLATLEIVISYFLPNYQEWLVYKPWTFAVGIALVLMGQIVRSVAMAQAGTNFNHTPARTRKADHELVTTGVYAYLRHPSYFGFFWWAIGTQILVGNKFCLLGYTLALWKFFHDRIIAEEKTLVEFFGKDYENFRKSTPVGIPFV